MNSKQQEEGDETIIPITEWPVDQRDEQEDMFGTSSRSKRPPLHFADSIICTDHSQSLFKSAKYDDKNCSAPLEECSVSTRVAKWWRNKPDQKDLDALGFGTPYTKLFRVARTPACKKFLRNERARLRSKVHTSPVTDQANVYAALAGVEDWLEEFESGKKMVTRAIHMNPENNDYKWLQEKLFRQCKILNFQREALRTIGKRALSISIPLSQEVQKVSVNSITVDQFKQQFVNKGEPVILTDAVQLMTDVPWDLELVKQKAGQCQVAIKKSIPNSVEWARLEESRTILVKDFIEKVQEKQTKEYLFDWSLPLHCTELADMLKVPSFFTGNYLRKTSPGSLYHDSWPSLFIAPEGVISNLHIDAFASNFWMALFQGQKRWTFFPPEDVPYLYPQYFHSMDPVFDVNLNQPDLEKHPLLSLTHPKQCVLRPGELLFVPGGSPHYVENLTDSLAVSSNIVDESNFSRVCEELRINALIDPRATDLLQQFKTNMFADCSIDPVKK